MLERILEARVSDTRLLKARQIFFGAQKFVEASTHSLDRLLLHNMGLALRSGEHFTSFDCEKSVRKH